MRRLGSIALLGCTLFAPAALAATVSVVPEPGSTKNSVLLNRGNGFAPIVAPTEGRSGDYVMTLGTGAATIIYEDNCMVEVNSKTGVVTVQETSPCKGAGLSEAEPTPRFGVGKYIVGAAIVGGAVTAAILIAGGDNGTKKKHHEKPGKSASP
jgi:hypothetical protein